MDEQKKFKEVPVSIIVPAFEIDKTEKALRHILKQNYTKKEIIVINDNPKFKISQSMLKFMKSKKIRLINNPANIGIAGSLNTGIKASKTQVISIICRDYFPKDKDWLNTVVKRLYSDKKIGCVVSPIVWPVEIWHRYPFLIRLFTFKHISKPKYGGGNYKKEVFEKTGLFNTRYAFAGEDCDMHTRMKKKGYCIEHIESEIMHVHYDENSRLSNVFKKEYRYGEAHGAIKREYGILSRIGLFDFEIRLLFLFGFIISLFINSIASLLFLLPFFLTSTLQAINSFNYSKWIPGLILYPFAGIIIIVVQTGGAINGFIKGKQNK